MPHPVQFVTVADGRIAYDVAGSGPLVVLSAGLADTRASYRFLAPLLIAAGYRVARVDLRGHGDSTVNWPSYTRTDTAADLGAVIDAIGGPATLVGQSFSGGAATIAAATAPELLTAVVEIAPFTQPPSFSARAFISNSAYRRGGVRLAQFGITGSTRTWQRYLEIAYPDRRPADWDHWLPALIANLNEPGRAAAAKKMVLAKPTDAAAQLPNVHCPTLIIMGANDSDFVDPEREAQRIVERLPAGVGRYAMVAGAGHYPQAQFPREVGDLIIAFLREVHHA